MRTPRFAWSCAVAALALAAAAGAADRSAPRARRKPAPETAPAATPAAETVVTPVAPATPAPMPAPMPTMTMTPTAVPGTPAPAVPAGPPGKAQIEELTHDAGSVERGTDIVHAFVIKNVGDNPLTVDAKPGCGCTVTEFDKVIAPGATGKVNATVHTTNFKGPISKSITVTTNDPENSRLTLSIKANVSVPVDVQPSENIAFNGKSESLSQQQVTIASVDGQPFDITGLTAADPSFTARVEPVPAEGHEAPATKPGTVASGVNKYRVTIDPSKNIAVGRLNSSVLVKTTHPKASDITLRIFGTVTGDVDVVPQYLTLSTGATAPEAAKVQHATIKKPTGEPLEILSVTADDPKVETSLKTVTEGREYDLEVKYAGEPTTTALSSKITIATNDPKQPKLEVQVWGRVDPGMRPPAQATSAPVPIRPAQAQAAPSP